MFNFYIKEMPVRYVEIGGQEVNACELYNVLEDFQQERQLNDYHTNRIIADLLVKEGVLDFRIGSRMAHLYNVTDKFEKFYDAYMNEYYSE